MKRHRYPRSLDKRAPFTGTQSQATAAQNVPQPSRGAAGIIDTQRKAYEPHALRAVWSPANCAFLVLFGHDEPQPCGIGPDSRTLFGTREELARVVESCGLMLTKANGIVRPEDVTE
jgi:hypothetical protein